MIFTRNFPCNKKTLDDTKIFRTKSGWTMQIEQE